MKNTPLKFKPKHHHIGISVSNLDKSIQWYTQILGFKVIKTFDYEQWGMRGAYLDLEGYQIECIETKGSDTYKRAFKDPGEQTHTQGIVHFALKVENVDEIAQKLKEMDVKFAWEPFALEDLKIKFCYIFDNDGNLIEFIEDLASS